jgi:hypothetical protein
MDSNDIIRSVKEWLESDGQRLLLPGTDPKKESGLPVSSDPEVPVVKADLRLMMKNSTEVFIELENSNGYADANVVKYWYYLNNHKDKTRKVVLLQALNPSTFKGGNYLSRKQIASDIGTYFMKKFSFFEFGQLDCWDNQAIKVLRQRLTQLAS